MLVSERSMCQDCNGTGAKPGTSPETCRKVWRQRVRLSIHQQSFFGTGTECADLSGPVAEPVRVVREKCPECAGTGYTSQARRRSRLSIPAGIDNGQSVRIREKGEPGVNGGPRGDLLVEVAVSRHPIFQRAGYAYPLYRTDILCTAQHLAEMIKIPTVDGDVSLHGQAGHKNRIRRYD